MTDWNTADPLEAAIRLVGKVDMRRDWATVDQQLKSAHNRAVGATQPTAANVAAYEAPAGRREHAERVKVEIRRLWLLAAHAHPDADATPSF